MSEGGASLGSDKGPAGAPTDRLTDDELWRGVEATLRDVLIPSLTDEWARAAAVQLVGVVRYARRRPADPLESRVEELRALLNALHANPIVQRHPLATGDARDVLDVVGRVLASAVDDSGTAGDEVRAMLRPVVVRQLDDELEITGPLVAAFRGRLDG
jgi:hypothetical protein